MLTRKKYEEVRDNSDNVEKNSKGIGMCASCVLEKDCVMSHQGNNLYACDEYQQGKIPKKQVDYKKEMKPVESLGLCATCSEKIHCQHKSLPGGVWHCEEFQ